MTDARLRGRQQFLLLAVLFFAPLVAAITLYFFTPEWQPEGRTNYGTLIQPARPLPEHLTLQDAAGEAVPSDVLRGKWSFVYVGGADCDTACADKLYQIRQIRTLLNEKRLRVQRVYLAPDHAAAVAAQAQLAPTHPDLHIFSETDSSRVLVRQFADGAPQADAQALYLLDPLGNWLMLYPAAAESTGILKDIKRLLRVSQIG
ncbi:MAG TPA: SCO family protein [Solimonas sp.]